jgi:hypothetical protein
MDPNYPQNPNYYPGAALPTSTMAIFSLVAGILGFTLLPIVGSIIAIITGMMARGETRGNPPRASGDGLATAGIIMGWVGVGLTVFGTICAVCVFATPFLMSIPFMLSGGGVN